MLRRKADGFPFRSSLASLPSRIGGTGDGSWVAVSQVLSRVPHGGVGAFPRFDGRRIDPLPDAATDRPNAGTDAPRPSEILFVDPSVADLGAILRNLRPGVEAILLDAERPAARQMAQALEGLDGLDAVHVIAHGAPGRVSFAAGEWSARTLDEDGVDLTTIGQALGGFGELLLWSCNAGAGAAGTNFIDALSCATGTPVAAADDLVGSPVLGGRWELNIRTEDAAARPPLTRGGIMNYAAVLAAIEITVSGLVPSGLAAGSTTYFVVDRDHGSIVGNINLPNMANRAFRITVRVPGGSTGLDVGVFDEAGKFTSAGFTVDVPAPPSGAVGPKG
ncbi:DUF4347 domain-containing protein [Mesorhizobium australicum]|uniref:DUF4347 domain-containing protein n=1 Tax=Mesorhizobium australicum TaxID=536018 RepID=UPI0033391602